MIKYVVRRKPRPMLSDARIEQERRNGRYVYVGHVNGYARFWRNECRFGATVEKRVPVAKGNLTYYVITWYKGKQVNLVFQRYPTYRSLRAALERKGIKFKKERVPA